MALIDTIRAQYPNPRRAYEDEFTTESYCVGGSLCRFAWQSASYRFPDPGEIVGALLVLNPRLDESEARVYATDIVYENDTGHFAAAWAAADKALTQNDTED